MAADRRLAGHARQHFGDVARLDGAALAAQFSGDIQQAAKIAAQQQLRANPDSRQIVVSAWNPVDRPNQALPPVAQ